jgi:hypothetical protein
MDSIMPEEYIPWDLFILYQTSIWKLEDLIINGTTDENFRDHNMAGRDLLITLGTIKLRQWDKPTFFWRQESYYVEVMKHWTLILMKLLIWNVLLIEDFNRKEETI